MIARGSTVPKPVLEVSDIVENSDKYTKELFQDDCTKIENGLFTRIKSDL